MKLTLALVTVACALSGVLGAAPPDGAIFQGRSISSFPVSKRAAGQGGHGMGGSGVGEIFVVVTDQTGSSITYTLSFDPELKRDQTTPGTTIAEMVTIWPGSPCQVTAPGVCGEPYKTFTVTYPPSTWMPGGPGGDPITQTALTMTNTWYHGGGQKREATPTFTLVTKSASTITDLPAPSSPAKTEHRPSTTPALHAREDSPSSTTANQIHAGNTNILGLAWVTLASTFFSYPTISGSIIPPYPTSDAPYHNLTTTSVTTTVTPSAEMTTATTSETNSASSSATGSGTSTKPSSGTDGKKHMVGGTVGLAVLAAGFVYFL